MILTLVGDNGDERILKTTLDALSTSMSYKKVKRRNSTTPFAKDVATDLVNEGWLFESDLDTTDELETNLHQVFMKL